ncbi:MAG: hypothetical protein F2534_00805 [Actinobacteria bacterium]|uniref:Unannotated protein n=1 Tax=freshwater metagenome TaxID=449393 RepID=A0A6J6BKY6_9ZZZZ|nr:hypothetical protein [Actinomycetota bacterium]
MLAVSAGVALFAGVACGGDDGSPATAASGVATEATVAVAPLPPVRPTTTSAAPTGASSTIAVSASTSSVPSTSATATTATSVPASSSTTTSTVSPAATPPPTTTPAAGPCDLTRIVTETGAVYDGITPDGLRCAGVWATWIGRPDDQFADGFFAVASWNGAAWSLANLGTAGVCEGAGVPAELWTRLGCVE